MLTNMEAQLKRGASSRLDEVLAEIPRVRADLGYLPLVTPTSQIVGTQAVLNVLAGERYKEYHQGDGCHPEGDMVRRRPLRGAITGSGPAGGCHRLPPPIYWRQEMESFGRASARPKPWATEPNEFSDEERLTSAVPSGGAQIFQASP